MKYVEVVHWSARDGSIHLEMRGEDQQIHHIDVSAECAGVLAGALTAEAGKLGGHGMEQGQLLRPTGMQTGKTEQGEPMLFMTLQGGAELPFVFKRESLGVLISELENLRGSLEAGSQVRWN